MIIGIVINITPWKTIQMIYASGSLVLSCMIFVYDKQLIAQDRTYAVSVQEYILAAIYIHMDIVRMSFSLFMIIEAFKE
jgi:FtsH-binding integral membrane protein